MIEAVVGLVVDSYEEPSDWRQQQRALAEGIIATEGGLSGEIGSVVAGRFAGMARGVLADMASRRYVQVLAHKP